MFLGQFHSPQLPAESERERKMEGRRTTVAKFTPNPPEGNYPEIGKPGRGSYK